MPPFHLAFPATDLEATRTFFTELLGCAVGRTSDRWIDFDFFGHQVTAQKVDHAFSVPTNHVDGKDVPAFHFGAILEWNAWHELAEKLQNADVHWLIKPYIRFQGQVGEQATMFVMDPNGNGLEFKSFKDESQIFAV